MRSEIFLRQHQELSKRKESELRDMQGRLFQTTRNSTHTHILAQWWQRTHGPELTAGWHGNLGLRGE